MKLEYHVAQDVPQDHIGSYFGVYCTSSGWEYRAFALDLNGTGLTLHMQPLSKHVAAL